MKAIIIIGILSIFLLVLTGCQSEIRGQQFEEIIIDDLCEDVSCKANEVCSDGSCSCDEGFKDCNGQCIADNACCGDSECGVGETCEYNTCEFSCDNLQCESNKVCDENKQGCFCKAGYKWCKLQNACIPEDHCCTKFDCDRDEKCINTAVRADFCVERDNDRNCKLLNDLDPKDFTVGGKEYEVFLKENLYDDYADFLINGENYTMLPQDRKQIDPSTIIWLKKLDEIGGSCKIFDSKRIGDGED